MADATMAAPTPTPGPRKRGRWLRALAFLFGLFIVLLVTVYFVVTSSAFLQNTVLPRVSKSLGADVTVSSAEVHPFSQIVLHDLKVQSTNQPTLLTAREIRLRFSLFDVIGGNFHADEITIASPTLQIVTNADGTSNLDPLMDSLKKSAAGKPKAAGKASRPLKVDIRKVTISNASVLRIQNHKNGTRDLAELTNVDVTITGVKNGEGGKVQFAAIIRDENNPPAPAMYGLLQAKVDGSFNFRLEQDLNPGPILGDAHLDISQAAGSFSEFAKLAGVLHCDYSPQEIKSISLNFEKDGVPLGELRASGPYDAQKSQGRLTVELLAVDKQVLNLFGAKSGFDFGSTTITLTNQIELSKSGAAISAAGQLSASKFELSRTNQSTPPIELRAEYNLSLDKTEKTALVRSLNVTGTQNGRPLLRAELASPMTLAWGNSTNVVGDSSFNFAVTKLNLAEWKMFVGEFISAGTVDLNLKLLSQQSGKRLTFDATNQIQHLELDGGGQHLSEVMLTLKTRGQATDLNQFNLSDYGLQLAKSNHTALAISGSGTYDRANGSADLQVTLQTTIARMLQLLGQTNIAASAGTAELKAHVTQSRQTQTVEGTLSVTNFTGKFGENQFNNFSTTMALDVNKTPEQIEIRKAAGTLAENRKAGGGFELSGTYSLTNKPTQLSVKFSDFNENGLRPFLEPLLDGKKLVSVALDGTASAQLNPNGDSGVKADVRIANLVVNDLAQQIPATPLEAKVLLDVAVSKQIADVHQLQITLTPTERGKNQFQLQGRVDTSKTNWTQGNLTLSADSLDLTRYYDLFAGTNKATAKATSQNKPQNTSAMQTASANEGLATNQLPLKNFTVAANVRELYLGEIAATNFQATLKLDGSHILLKPFQLTLNGSLMRATADVDLGVPGYKYALTFCTTNVPFAPLWNTFEPDRKGQMGGTLTAWGEINGVGTTGESLQKSLTGRFDIGTTNLNLSVKNIQNGMMRLLVVAVGKLPEIFENPVSAGLSLVSGMAKGALTGGLSDELNQAPIDVIALRGTAGNGKVVLERAVVRSTVFEGVVTNGTVTLAEELTNSPIDIPVSISINKAFTSRLQNFSFADASTNGNYVKLPDFFSEIGTVGEPKPKINPVPIAKATVQAIVPGLIGGTNGTGSLLQGIGGLLQGGGANTNQPATNQVPVNNLLNRFLGPGGK
jgi:hypothetical protein